MLTCCKNLYNFYKLISIPVVLLMTLLISIFAFTLYSSVVANNELIPNREMPKHTKFNGTFDLFPNQTVSIQIDKSFFSGGYPEMDEASWEVDFTIGAGSDFYLNLLDIARICEFDGYLKSCTVNGSQLHALDFPSERKSFPIVIYNNSTYYNNIAYSFNISSRAIYPAKIDSLFIDEFILLMIIIGLSCISLLFVPGVILDMYTCTNELCEKKDTLDGPNEETHILHNRL